MKSRSSDEGGTRLLEFVGEDTRHFAFGSFGPGCSCEFPADQAARMLTLKDEGGKNLWAPAKAAKPKEQDDG